VFKRFIAHQLARPSGLFGRWVTSRWLDRDNLMMNQVTLERLDIQPNDKILEVGFGSGYLLEQILSTKPCSHVAGVDLSIEMVRLVRRRLQMYISSGKVDIHEGSIEALSYDDSEFTKLCSVNTLYFWRDPIVALSECRRVLKENGLLVLCFNSKEEMKHWSPHQFGFRLYELAEVESLLHKTGFGGMDVLGVHDPAQGLFHCVNAKAVG